MKKDETIRFLIRCFLSLKRKYLRLDVENRLLKEENRALRKTLLISSVANPHYKSDIESLERMCDELEKCQARFRARGNGK